MSTETSGHELIPALSRRAVNMFAPLQHQIDRVFDDFTTNFEGMARFTSPKMDIAETDKEVELSVELPGLSKSDVKIAIEDDILTVSGEKKFSKDDKGRNYRVIERSYGAFSRSVQLPKGAKADDVKAVMTDGVLKVTIAKPAVTVAKTVEIRTA